MRTGTVLLLAVATSGYGSDGAGRPSAGCARPAPAVPPVTLQVDGRARHVLTVVPEGYTPDVPHALVLALHGRTTSNLKARAYLGLEAHAKRPTVFVYPAALVAADGKYSWYEPGDRRDRLRDYVLFDAVVEAIGAAYCIDLDRVFVVGHSLGGSFANSLGCARGSLIRGVGTVAGRVWEAPCSGPAAAIILHNPKDDLVPFERGLEARDHALRQNGLGPPSRPCEPLALRCERYGPPGAPDPVVWCPHGEERNGRGDLYPHLWPRDAGRAIMEFFESLPPAVATGWRESDSDAPTSRVLSRLDHEHMDRGEERAR